MEIDVRKIWRELKKYPDVVGFDASLRPKIVGGKEQKVMALRIYVKRKRPLCALRPKDVIPKEIDGIPTDVIEIGEIKSLESTPSQADPKQRYRPYMAGTSACHKDCTACTSTAFFRDKKTGKVLFGLNNHCYLPDTEVLTSDGFRKWSEVSQDTRFATLNAEGKLEWRKATKFFKLWYEGPLLRLIGQGIQLTVTPGHQVLVADAWRHSKKHSEFRLKPLDYLLERIRSGKTTSCRFTKIAKWEGVDSSFWNEDLLKFLAWYLTEGSACETKYQHLISIRQREWKYYEEIYALMKRLEPRTWKCKSAVVSNSPKLISLLKRLGLYKVHANYKFVPKEVKELPPHKLKIFLETCLKGDGDQERFNTSSKQLADDIQEIMLKCGIPSNLEIEEGSTNFSSQRKLYRVRILKQPHPIINRVERIDYYKGFVYDVTVPNHTLFIRENGKTCWSGNCGAQENTANIGDAWIQPGPYDGGKYPEDIVAKLYRIVPIKFYEYECPYRNFFHKLYLKIVGEQFNTVDICFAEPVVDYKIEVLNLPGMFKGVREPTIGEQVQKMGRTTGVTTGIVESVSWTGEVQYGRGTALFTDCILIRGYGFSAGGDSSSPVFDMQGNLVGILFAGSDLYTVLCKIKNIEKEGNVETITVG